MHVSDAFQYLKVEETIFFRYLLTGGEGEFVFAEAAQESAFLFPVFRVQRFVIDAVCVVEARFRCFGFLTLEFLDDFEEAPVTVLAPGAVAAEHHQVHVLVEAGHAARDIPEVLGSAHHNVFVHCRFFRILEPLRDVRALLGSKQVHHVRHGSAHLLVVLLYALQGQAAVDPVTARYFRDLPVKVGALAGIQRHGTCAGDYAQAGGYGVHPHLCECRERLGDGVDGKVLLLQEVLHHAQCLYVGLRCEDADLFQACPDGLAGEADEILCEFTHRVERLLVSYDEAAVKVHAADRDGNATDKPALGFEHLVGHETGECDGKKLFLPAHIVEVVHERAVPLPDLLLHLALVEFVHFFRRLVGLGFLFLLLCASHGCQAFPEIAVGENTEAQCRFEP